jgi:hypothetical protein
MLQSMVPVILAVALGFWLVPPATLLVVGGREGLGPAAAAATISSALFWMLIAYGMKIPPVYGLGYPLGAAMTLFIVARSVWRGGRRVVWRGRTYRSA